MSSSNETELRRLVDVRVEELRTSVMAYEQASKFWERCVYATTFLPVVAGMVLVTPNIVAMVSDDEATRNAVLLTNAAVALIELFVATLVTKLGVEGRATALRDAARDFSSLVRRVEVQLVDGSHDVRAILEEIETETRRILNTAPMVPQLGTQRPQEKPPPRERRCDSDGGGVPLSSDPWIAYQQRRMSSNALYVRTREETVLP